MKKYAALGLFVSALIVAAVIYNLQTQEDIYLEGYASSLNKTIYTKEELEWIEAHRNRIFSVGVSHTYAPIEYIDGDGQPAGIGIEIIKEVNALTGLKFKLYKNNRFESWAEKLTSTQDTRIDLLPSVSLTDERERYLDFSIPYIEMTQIVVGHQDKYKLINSITDVKEETFAVPKGYWFEETILKENTRAKIVYVKNMEEALEYVARGKADYTICEIPVFTYYREEYKNIKIVGELPEKNKIHIGIRKEFRGLIPVVNGVIENMDYDEIFERALASAHNNEREKKLAYLSALLLIILLIAVFFLFNTYKKLHLAKQEAEETNKDKTKLMANISHDLRTPITVAMGYLEAIIDGEVVKTEDKEKYIRISYQRLKYLSELVDDFFFLARVEDSKFILNKEPIDINSYLSGIVDNTGTRAQSQNINFISRIDREAKIIKEIDQLKFYRAMENIIMNAFKYCHDNKTVEIGTIAQEDGRVKIYIKDNGQGIHEADLPHIFERYFKGKNSSGDSIGLGLYIAKEIIEKHNGEIWVESEPNKGSTFFIIL